MYENVDEAAMAARVLSGNPGRQAQNQAPRAPRPRPAAAPVVVESGWLSKLGSFNIKEVDIGEVIPDLGMGLGWSAMYLVGFWSFLLTLVQWKLIQVATLDPIGLITGAPFQAALVFLIYVWVTRTEQKYWFVTEDIGDFIHWFLVCVIDYFGIFFGVVLAFNSLNININGWGLTHGAWWTVVVAAIATFLIAFCPERQVLKYFGRVKEQFN